MWENETIVLITSFKKRLLSGNTKVRFGKISADTAIPPFIKAIFQDQVEKFIRTEIPIAIQSTPHFDITEKDILQITDRFQEVFRELAAFSSDEVEEVLRIALIQRMDYLVKPADTMRRLLFDGRQSISIEEIDIILNPFKKTIPYAEKLMEECTRLSYTAIENDEYSNLINEILHRMSEKEPVKLVIHDFSILIDYISETKGEEINRVEGRVLQEFMADRNLWGFRRAIDVEMKLGKEDFNAIDLEMTLKRYIELKSEFNREEDIVKTAERVIKPFEAPSVESTEVENDIQFEDLKLAEKNDESIDLNDIVIPTQEKSEVEDIRIKPPESKEDVNEGWDLDDVLGSETLIQEEKPVEPKEELTKKSKEVKPEEKTQSKKQMRIIRRDQNQPVSADSEVKDEFTNKVFSTNIGLRQMIDSKTEKVFVKKLFGNDQSAYDQLMKKLEESDSWRVAKILIDNELFKRDVDPFSREAIKLVDLVYSRYYPEEGVGGK